jgi:hypothetical protein
LDKRGVFVAQAAVDVAIEAVFDVGVLLHSVGRIVDADDEQAVGSAVLEVPAAPHRVGIEQVLAVVYVEHVGGGTRRHPRAYGTLGEGAVRHGE